MLEHNIIRIAIIDDARLVLNGWEKTFRDVAYIELLFVAANKKLFLDLCEKHEAELDILIMDKSIDGKTQFDDFEYISKTRKRFPTKKIIVYTWDYYTGHINYLKKMGVNAYLPGKCDVSEMITAIRRVMKDELYFPNDEKTLEADREKYFGTGHMFNLETIRETDELNPAEIRVAALLSHDFTKNQIAERLCVSVKTIEKHITNIYRTLGIFHGETNTRITFNLRYGAFFRQKFPNVK